jgi:hypothetical protein
MFVGMAGQGRISVSRSHFSNACVRVFVDTAVVLFDSNT